MAERDDQAAAQRLDKWLWFSRVLKSRTLAAELVTEGKVRVNRTRVTKPSQSIRAGDVLTIALRGRVQVLRVLAPGERRGPAADARLLYEVISTGAPEGSQVAENAAPVAQRAPGSGRPSKRDRRQTDRLTEPE
jgi:ribosome-associated heat shock protein Hsp15